MQTSHDEYVGRLLEAIDAGGQVSQRSLARDLGIALGLTNLLLKRLAVRGLIRMARVQRHRVRYLLTPAGIAEKARMSQRAFEYAVDRYRTARTRLEATFTAVSASFPPGVRDKRLIFYGSGEVAEIAYICLQERDLRLVGVVDDCGRQGFFGLPVYSNSADLRALVSIGDVRLVVASVRPHADLQRAIEPIGLPEAYVFWP